MYAEVALDCGTEINLFYDQFVFELPDLGFYLELRILFSQGYI
jgi:hypothetical protein